MTDDRQQRLSAALRANLRRRKAVAPKSQAAASGEAGEGPRRGAAGADAPPPDPADERGDGEKP